MNVSAGGTDDLTNKNVVIDPDGYLYAQFTRALTTQDTFFDQQIDLNKQYSMVYSCSPYQSLSYAIPEHQVSASGAARCAGMTTLTFSNTYQCTKPTTGNSYMSQNKDFSATWNFNTDSINFSMTATATGWIGIGFSSSAVPAHSGSDMVVAWIDSEGYVQIIDGFSSTKTQPTYDPVQNVMALSGSNVGGQVVVNWTRLLNTGDAANDYTITKSPLTFAWAYHKTAIPTGTGAGAQYLYHSARDSATISLLTSPVTPVTGHTFQGTDFSASWNIIADTITFNMTSKGVGWISVGFSAGNINAHKGSDMVVAWVDTAGAVQIIDGFSSFQGPPFYDQQQDAIPLAGAINAGQVYIVWSRLLNTNDPQDYPITNAPLMFAYAFHKTNIPDMPGPQANYFFHDVFDEKVVNLFTGTLPFYIKMTPALSLSLAVSAVIVVYSFVRFSWKGYKLLSSKKIPGREDPDRDPLKDMKATRDGVFLRGSMAVDYAHQTPRRQESGNDDESPPLPESEDVIEPSFSGKDVALKEYGRKVFSPEKYTALNEKKTGNQGITLLARLAKARLPLKGNQVSVIDMVGFLTYLFINLGYVIWWPLQGYPPNVTFGYLAIANAFFIALPATRNSVLVYLLGVPFDKTIQFHRWLGYLCLLESTFHWAYFFPYTLAYPKFKSGLITWLFIFFVFITSIESMRRFYFNWFYALHFSFIGFYIAGVMHSTEFTVYTILAAIFYGLDRIARFFFGAVPKRALDMDVHDGAVKITFNKNSCGRYALGQYVFLNFPEIGLLEWHPFTLSSGPEEPTSEVLIKGIGDFTKKLVTASREKGKLWIRVDGPYGKWYALLHFCLF
jgi:hypothetical protein